MAKQITKTVYTYAELLALHEQKPPKVTSAALDRAKSWLSEAQTSHDWWDYIYELWGKALTQIGFEDAEISFSGFGSQGDGASFTCPSVNLEKLIRFLAANIAPSECIKGSSDPDGWTAEGGEDFRNYIAKHCEVVPVNTNFNLLLDHLSAFSANVSRISSSHYCHENSCDFNFDYNSISEELVPLAQSFEKAAEELRHSLSHAIYECLNREYDDITSDGALAEFAEANEYTFTINGIREG